MARRRVEHQDRSRRKNCRQCGSLLHGKQVRKELVIKTDDSSALPGALRGNTFGSAAITIRLKEQAPSRAAVAEAERVIVTGSNIPTAERDRPNPADTIVRQTSRAGIRKRDGPDNVSTTGSGGTLT